MARKKTLKKVESLRHPEANRKNIPTAEFRAVMAEDERTPIEVAYQRRNRDLDPQLVWRGKDEQDQGDLIAQAAPLYIQEKVHPKVLIDDLVQHAKDAGPPDETIDLFADFNGLPPGVGQTDFYEHDANWSNRMILGDSLHVMASLAEREDLRGKVQCIYFDPPYGIKFNSNFQWSTTSRDVKDGNRKAHHPRTRAGQGVPRHMARRSSLLPQLSPGSAHCRPRPAVGQRISLRADRRRERAPGARADG